jgi:hypothetical protein
MGNLSTPGGSIAEARVAQGPRNDPYRLKHRIRVLGHGAGAAGREPAA